MLTELLIEATAREGRSILDAVKKSPDADVDCRPGWDTTRLLGHVGGVHRFITRIVANRATEPLPGEPTDKPPADTELWGWYEEGLDALLDALRSIEPTEPVWSWTDRCDGGFYQRRMAHENTMHRYDAEAATGTPAHIHPELATDGVAEILAVAMRYRGDGRPIEYPGSSMLLVRTDGADRWLVRAMDGTLLIAHNGDAGNRADAAAAWSAVAP